MDVSFDSNTEYTDRTFRKVNARGKTVDHCTFENCAFLNCIFQETVFEGCKFRDCTFQDCDLRLMRLPGTAFRETTFRKCMAIGVNWAGAGWSRAGLLEVNPITFIESEVSHSSFMGLNLQKLVMKACIAIGADFSDANLTRADFSGTDFSEARFAHTNLTEANFSDARSYAIDPALNTIKKAKFSLPEAVNLLRSMDIVLVDPLA